MTVWHGLDRGGNLQLPSNQSFCDSSQPLYLQGSKLSWVKITSLFSVVTFVRICHQEFRRHVSVTRRTQCVRLTSFLLLIWFHGHIWHPFVLCTDHWGSQATQRVCFVSLSCFLRLTHSTLDMFATLIVFIGLVTGLVLLGTVLSTSSMNSSLWFCFCLSQEMSWIPKACYFAVCLGHPSLWKEAIDMTASNELMTMVLQRSVPLPFSIGVNFALWYTKDPQLHNCITNLAIIASSLHRLSKFHLHTSASLVSTALSHFPQRAPRLQTWYLRVSGMMGGCQLCHATTWHSNDAGCAVTSDTLFIWMYLFMGGIHFQEPCGITCLWCPWWK